MDELKTCFKCQQAKPRSEFYAHPQMGDGLLGKCKECTKSDVKTDYQKKRSQKSAYEHERNRRPERLIAKRVAAKRYRKKYPERARARQAVAKAVRSGRLIRKPCRLCGKKAQAHHEDYSKKLEVDWLCFKCHREHGHGQVVTSTFL